jgi:hypothetical protein
MEQIPCSQVCHTAAMPTQTIPEYLEEERQKNADTLLRTTEEAARIQPLQHGHHRTAKQSSLQPLPPAKAATRKKAIEKKATKNKKAIKTAVVSARKKPSSVKKKTAKARKRA